VPGVLHNVGRVIPRNQKESSNLSLSKIVETHYWRVPLHILLLTFLMLCSPTRNSAQTAPLADHHTHLQSPHAAQILNDRAHSDPSQAQAIPEKPYTAKDLVAALDAVGIPRATALSEAYLLAGKNEPTGAEKKAVDEENDWTLSEVKQFPKRLVGFCSVNPIRSYALAAIQHCEKIGLRGGLKLHLAAANFHFSNPAQLRQLQDAFREANRQHMPILLHLHPDDDNWDGARDSLVFFQHVLSQAPDVPVQIAHMAGWGGYDRSADAALSTFARQCAQHPKTCAHLYFDISGVLIPPAAAQAPAGSDLRFAYEHQKNFPSGPQRLAANIRKLGLQRILFATDWPVFEMKESIKLLRNQTQLTSAEVDQIFANTAPYLGPLH
jgi:uncharacterized protein